MCLVPQEKHSCSGREVCVCQGLLCVTRNHMIGIASLGTREVCKLIFYLLWHMRLASLPYRQISSLTGLDQANHTIYLIWDYWIWWEEALWVLWICVKKKEKKRWLPVGLCHFDNAPWKCKQNWEVPDNMHFATWSGDVRLWYTRQLLNWFAAFLLFKLRYEKVFQARVLTIVIHKNYDVDEPAFTCPSVYSAAGLRVHRGQHNYLGTLKRLNFTSSPTVPI